MTDIKLALEDLWDAHERSDGKTYLVASVESPPPPPPPGDDGTPPPSTTVEPKLFEEIAKASSFSLVQADSRRRFVATDAITVTLPAVGLLGNGFECKLINDSGATVTIDGPGETDVELDDGDVAVIMEANSKQLVTVSTSTSIADFFEVGTAWDPTVFGTNFDLIRWWDATRNIIPDAVTGKVTEWDDWIQKDAIAQGKATQTDITKQPAWVNGDEIRFEGPHIGLQMGTMGRAYFENRWLMIMFRVNWTAMSAGITDAFLLAVNGTSATGAGWEFPQVNINVSTHELTAVWMNSNATKHTVTVAVPGGDDTWHSFITRRNENAIYASIDGGAEETLACYPRNFVPSAATRTGYIGNPISSGTPPSFSWGLSDLLMGQGTLTDAEVAKFHAWGMYRKGAEADLDVSSPYLDDPPTATRSEVHVESQDSYARGYRFLASGGWDDSLRGEAINLSGYSLDFQDHFTDVSTITDGLSGNGPLWWAPAHIDTSSAHFRRPGESVPDTFTILPDNTTLQIKLSRAPTLYSGHIQSVDAWGNGNVFTCPVGGAMYFEARMGFNQLGGNATDGFVNPAPGWPAFWLYSQSDRKDGAQSKAELDIVEAYGVGNLTTAYQMHQTHHLHGAYRPQPGNLGSVGNTGQVTHTETKAPDMRISPFNITTPLFDGQGNGQPRSMHVYGCKIDETWISTYFNGLMVTRYPTFMEALGPLYVLVSLQCQDATGYLNVETYMWVDYVNVYTKS